MLFDHALRQPVRDARAFHEVVIYRPNPAALCIDNPVRMLRRHIDRMFDREDEMSFRLQRAMHLRHQTGKVLDIVERQRTVHQIKRTLRQLNRLHVGTLICNHCASVHAPRTRQHVL
jgi:hypothetical protein